MFVIVRPSPASASEPATSLGVGLSVARAPVSATSSVGGTVSESEPFDVSVVLISQIVEMHKRAFGVHHTSDARKGRRTPGCHHLPRNS